jgi:hypothetical protein
MAAQRCFGQATPALTVTVACARNHTGTAALVRDPHPRCSCHACSSLARRPQAPEKANAHTTQHAGPTLFALVALGHIAGRGTPV